MSETQLNDNQLALNTETGSFAEMIFATQIGKEALAQRLTEKGSTTAASETLLQMADKLAALNTNNSLVFGKGKDIFSSYNSSTFTGETISSITSKVLLKNNYILISTKTTCYICDLSRTYDDIGQFLAQAVVTFQWQTSAEGDRIGLSEDMNTIVRIPSSYSETYFEFYDLSWSNGAPTAITYLKRSTSSNKKSDIDSYTTYPSGIIISNDRKLVAYTYNSYYFYLESVDDDTIRAQASYSFSASCYPYAINGGDVYVYSPVYGHYAVIKYNVTEENGEITAITYDKIQDNQVSLSPYACPNEYYYYIYYSSLYLREQNVVVRMTYKASSVELNTSSPNKVPEWRLYVIELPTASRAMQVYHYDLGKCYKLYYKNSTTKTYFSDTDIDSRTYPSYAYKIGLYKFLFKTSVISSGVIGIELISGQKFSINLNSHTITETTEVVTNYASPVIQYLSTIDGILFKTSNGEYYSASGSTAYKYTFNANAKDIITDINLNYNNTPICIYPLEVYSGSMNGLITDTIEVPVS